MEPRRSVHARVLLVIAAVAGLLLGATGPVRAAAEHRTATEAGPSGTASAGQAVQRERRVEPGQRSLQVSDVVLAAGVPFVQHLWQAAAPAPRLPGRAQDRTRTDIGSVPATGPPVPAGRAPPQSAGT